MFEISLVLDILNQINESIDKINKRFKPINSSDDFINSDAGQGVLDSICKQLIAIGESLKNIDKIMKK